MIDLKCFIYYVSLYDVDLISLICIMIYDVDVHFRVRDWSILNLPPEPRILDEDYNLVIAPIMQRRAQKLVEVKHGDLAPGKAHGKGGKGDKGNGDDKYCARSNSSTWSRLGLVETSQYIMTPHISWPIPCLFLFWNRFLRHETDRFRQISADKTPPIGSDEHADSVRPSSVRMASQVPTEVQRSCQRYQSWSCAERTCMLTIPQ